jgi:hypothetical protein
MNANPMEPEGKTALVTGPTSGTGKVMLQHWQDSTPW